MSPPNNVILVGLSGTGKTQVGQEVARLLGWDFIDTDAEIESREGRPIHQIFTEDGEPAFRLLEKLALQEACAGQATVVSTGGGAVIDPDNRKLMLRRGYVVWLDADPETLFSRLSAGGNVLFESRPLLSGREPLDRIKALKSQRQSYYSEAHLTVHADGLTVQQTALEVMEAWRRFSALSGVPERPYRGQVQKDSAPNR